MTRSFVDGLINFGVGVALTFCLFAALIRGKVITKDEAVKAGKAEYYLDENNEKQWRWK